MVADWDDPVEGEGVMVSTYVEDDGDTKEEGRMVLFVLMELRAGAFLGSKTRRQQDSGNDDGKLPWEVRR